MMVKTHPRGGRAPLSVPRIMAPKMDVVPAQTDTPIPPHPIDGPLPPEGGKWTRDQYTFRMLIDGTIKRAEEAADATDAPAAPPVADEAAPHASDEADA